MEFLYKIYVMFVINLSTEYPILHSHVQSAIKFKNKLIIMI